MMMLVLPWPDTIWVIALAFSTGHSTAASQRLQKKEARFGSRGKVAQQTCGRLTLPCDLHCLARRGENLQHCQPGDVLASLLGSSAQGHHPYGLATPDVLNSDAELRYCAKSDHTGGQSAPSKGLRIRRIPRARSCRECAQAREL
jgi:hypothetical protein